MRELVAAGITLVLCVAAFFGGVAYTPPVAPTAAIGMAVCGKLIGAVIAYSDGTQVRLKPEELPAKMPEVEKLRQDQKAILAWTGEACSGRPRVY